MIAGPIIRVGFQTPLIYKEAGGSAKETYRPHAGALLPPNPQVRHLIKLRVPRWPLWQPATQNKAHLGSTRARVMHVRLQNELVPPVGALRLFVDPLTVHGISTSLIWPSPFAGRLRKPTRSLRSAWCKREAKSLHVITGEGPSQASTVYRFGSLPFLICSLIPGLKSAHSAFNKGAMVLIGVRI
jgi:hypothetical protein